MISREAADAIAEALLEPAQEELRRRRNARVRYTSLFYRSSKLKKFEPWQRDAIIRRCAALVTREPLTIVLFAAWLLIAYGVGFTLPARVFGLSIGGLAVFVGLLFVLYHRLRTRHYVRAFIEFVDKNQRNGENAG
jgi:hypothetical protein